MRIVLSLLAVMLALSACAPESAQTANAGAPAAAHIIVRFETDHTLARAQALEAAGDHAGAVAAANAALAADPTLAGLCLERFTLGGSEIVLASCAPLAPGAEAIFVRQWSERLARMEGVAYAEPNYQADAN